MELCKQRILANIRVTPVIPVALNFCPTDCISRIILKVLERTSSICSIGRFPEVCLDELL